MRTVTDRFLQTITGSYQLAITAILSTGAASYSIPIVDGSVTLDQRAATRGRCDLTIQPDDSTGLDLVPTTALSLLAPYGNEITVGRGIEYADGTTEVVSLGVFRVESANVEDGPTGQTIRVTGMDRSAIVIDATFEEPYQVASGTNYATAISDVLTAGYPSIQTSFPTTDLTTPALIAQEGEDRWAFAQRMAQAIGHELYFNGNGTCVLVPTTTLSGGSSQADLVEGEGGVLLSLSRSWSRAGAFNKVIATGENTGEGAPVRGPASDDNPASPTYYGGAFGRVPRFYSSPLITTTDQATDAAASLLARELGTTQQISFGTLVNPALEPGDVVRITRLASAVDEYHVIDTLTIPLSPSGTMSGTTRATQGV
jgi:hypothetical protein